MSNDPSKDPKFANWDKIVAELGKAHDQVFNDMIKDLLDRAQQYRPPRFRYWDPATPDLSQPPRHTYTRSTPPRDQPPPDPRVPPGYVNPWQEMLDELNKRTRTNWDRVRDYAKQCKNDLDPNIIEGTYTVIEERDQPHDNGQPKQLGPRTGTQEQGS
jgi:hypothetical protein